MIPNYDSVDNLDLAYRDFTSGLASVINAVAPVETVRIKNNTREWFDGKIPEEIHKRDKLYEKFKLAKLHLDEDLFREA